MVGEKQPRPSRRSFLKSASATAGSYFVLSTTSATSDDEIRYIAGWRVTNRPAVKRGQEQPNVEEVYDTINESRREKVEAQREVANRITKDIKENTNEKTAALIPPTQYNRAKNPDTFKPGISLDWTERNGHSPDMSEGEARERYSGRTTGKAENGAESEVVVEVEHKTPTETGCTFDEKTSNVVPSGLRMSVEVIGGQNIFGTVGPACYDQDNGTSGWLSAAHLFHSSDSDPTDWAYQPRVESYAYFGTKERERYDPPGYLDSNDMAVLHSDDKGRDPRYYVWGDDSKADCPTPRRALWGRSNQWIENNQGKIGTMQGWGSYARKGGEIAYRANTFFLTRAEVLLRGTSPQDGDSGGPMFQEAYNSKYDETAAYIVGVTARNTNGDAIGNTYEAFKNEFNIVI